MFLYIDPLKQGLKLLAILSLLIVRKFLYIDPLKQGLKHIISIDGKIYKIVFIHRSIKTRIETDAILKWDRDGDLFLYIDPLKQGLKHIIY